MLQISKGSWPRIQGAVAVSFNDKGGPTYLLLCDERNKANPPTENGKLAKWGF